MKGISKGRSSKPQTLGELVVWAFDVSPNRAVAIELLERMMKHRSVRYTASPV